MKTIRVGFLGTRGHTLKFISLINGFEESGASAIWSDDREKAEKTAAEGHVQFCSTPEEVLALCDAVVITAPNAYKKELVIKAARSGKHIFLEKPLAVNAEDGREMAEAVIKSGVKFFMSDPFVRNGIIGLKNMISEGTLGEITGGDVRIAVDRAVVPGHPPVWNPETALGGILADIGGHALHVIHYLFGKPESVYAELDRFTRGAMESGMEDNAVLILKYPGKIITMNASWISGGNSAHTLIYGTKGWAEVISLPGGNEVQKLVIHTDNGTVSYEGEQLPAPPKRHVRYFIDMIVNDLPDDIIGRDPLSGSGVSISDACEYAEIIEAGYRSASEGRKITL